MVLSSIFALLEVILRLFGLWDGLVNYLDAKRLADEQKKAQDRDAAVDKAKSAKTPDDAYDAQSGIVNSEP